MKNSLSTGQVASYCGVDYRTVANWIKHDYMRAFKLPGRGDYRVPVPECVRFLRSNGIPVPAELEERCGTTRIVVVEDDKAVLATLKTILEKAGYEGGGRVRGGRDADGTASGADDSGSAAAASGRDGGAEVCPE